jgi:hypothetical protein
MLSGAAAVWIVGLVTIVPYGTYYLLFRAQRDEYALLITGVLFWIFGYWSVVGPVLAAIKARRVLRTIEQARSKQDLMNALQSDETREAAIELIASDNHIPRFLAARIYRLLIRRLSSVTASSRPSSEPPIGDETDHEARPRARRPDRGPMAP